MIVELITQFRRGNREQPGARRDRAIAAALRGLLRSHNPSTCTAYLIKDGVRLVPVMTIDTPLSFTVHPRTPVGDELNPTALAYDTNAPVFFDWATVQRLTRRDPELLLSMPVPMVVASVPVSTPRRRLGALTLRWELPHRVGTELLTELAGVGRRLGAELEALADDGETMDAPAVPLFVDRDPARPTPPGGGHGPRADRPAIPSERRGPPAERVATSSSFLYQVHRLAARLAAAEHVQDVVAAAQNQVVRPFGGRALMLCVAEGGRLHVLGAAGFAHEAVGRVEGTALDARSPETDALSRVQVLWYTTAAQLLRDYPDAEPEAEPDFLPRAYLPLVSRGRVVGCCVLEFPAGSRRLSAEKTALAVLMLEAVGQSLERTRSHETEQALSRTVQRSLLPRSLPHLSEADATARYLPAAEQSQVGGDWYDVIRLPNGGAGLVIGDVEGHALEAAGIMGQLRSAVRAYATEGHDPASVLERSNRLFAGLGADRYATCCCMWVDLATGAACVATAGHHGPLVSGERGMCPVDVPVGPPLGVARRPAYRNLDVTLAPGSLVALFTDGMIDSRRLGTGAAVRRLGSLIADDRGSNLEVLADRLVRESRPARVLDDAALLLLRFDGPHAEGPPRTGRIAVERHDLQGVARVRRFLDDLLVRWGLPALRDDLDLLATEVVTNALIHAHSEVEVRLREYPDRVRVDVRDSDPHPPVPSAILTADAAGNQAAESGRGLLIVEMLAAAWGSSPNGRGKTTWFDVAVPPELRNRRHPVPTAR